MPPFVKRRERACGEMAASEKKKIRRESEEKGREYKYNDDMKQGLEREREKLYVEN